MDKRREARMTFPQDGSPAHFDELTEPLIEAVRFAYSLRRKNRGKDIPWNGPDLTLTRLLCCCFNISESLSRESLEYNENDQGRDALAIIVSCAIQLGIEQGIRMKMQELIRYKGLLLNINKPISAERFETFIKEGGLSPGTSTS